MELKNMGTTENKKIFRKHLIKFHPNKYYMFIIMEKEKPIDIKIKFFSMISP
jgi:hypothetical protein